MQKIPFRNVMNEWLYARDGYYRSYKDCYVAGSGFSADSFSQDSQITNVKHTNVNNIGKNGDFYTSVSLSKFFGGAIARYILSTLESGLLKMPLFVVEIGSNNGELIADIAEFLKAFNSVVFNDTTFCTLEPFKHLREMQEVTFSTRITNRFYKKLHSFSSFKQMRMLNENIFFVSNELFDSMPCDLVRENKMLYSGGGSSFVWDKIDSKVERFIESYEVKSAEVPLSWEKFIKDMVGNLYTRWIFLSFDYGDFLARDMNLRIFFKHKVYNFFEELQNNKIINFVKKSDITYDVDFSLLEKIFARNAIRLESLFCETQAKTLIERCEILDVFESFTQSFSQNMLVRQKVSLQGLIMPNAMGERFKSLCVGCF